MGNQMDDHVYRDALRLEELLSADDVQWDEAYSLLYECDYTYPHQVADLLSYVFRSLPKHKETEDFVTAGVGLFVSNHQNYGTTHISWWFDTYQYILSGVSNHGFDLTPHYVKIYDLLLSCCYFEEGDSTDSAIEDACSYIGDSHPLIAELRAWASEED